MFVATKDLNYGTRRLKAGDTFEARPHDYENARLLVILGFARETDADAIEHDAILDDLRATYVAIFGKPADGRWGAGRIRKEIAAARK